MSEENKQKLINYIEDLPDEYYEEMLHFAEFLKEKGKDKMDFFRIAEYVIGKNKSLLKRLAE